jgi:hypothetical protein
MKVSIFMNLVLTCLIGFTAATSNAKPLLERLDYILQTQDLSRIANKRICILSVAVTPYKPHYLWEHAEVTCGDVTISSTEVVKNPIEKLVSRGDGIITELASQIKGLGFTFMVVSREEGKDGDNYKSVYSLSK